MLDIFGTNYSNERLSHYLATTNDQLHHINPELHVYSNTVEK